MITTVEGALSGGFHRAELTAYCRRMLGSSFDAEDAVQETFLRAWRASGRFEGRAPVRTWLYRIATNVCLDALGRTARLPLPVEELPQPPDCSGEPDPADRALDRERLQLGILAALGVLAPRQRAILILRDVLSWRASEVAELLGMTPVAVNSALQRAHAALESIDPAGVSDATVEPDLVGRYVAAFAADDVNALVSLSRGT